MRRNNYISMRSMKARKKYKQKTITKSYYKTIGLKKGELENEQINE